MLVDKQDFQIEQPVDDEQNLCVEKEIKPNTNEIR